MAAASIPTTGSAAPSHPRFLRLYHEQAIKWVSMMNGQPCEPYDMPELDRALPNPIGRQLLRNKSFQRLTHLACAEAQLDGYPPTTR